MTVNDDMKKYDRLMESLRLWAFSPDCATPLSDTSKWHTDEHMLRDGQQVVRNAWELHRTLVQYFCSVGEQYAELERTADLVTLKKLEWDCDSVNKRVDEAKKLYFSLNRRYTNVRAKMPNVVFGQFKRYELPAEPEEVMENEQDV